MIDMSRALTIFKGELERMLATEHSVWAAERITLKQEVEQLC